MRRQNEGKGVVGGGGGLNLRAWSMGVVNYVHPRVGKIQPRNLDGAVASRGSVLMCN